jgi:hypothetical protein
MAIPNDSQRIARGLGNLETSTTDYTQSPQIAARSIIRKTYVLYKALVDGAAGTATAYTAGYNIRMKNPGRILGAYVMPIGAVTADASNNATVNAISADGAGGAAVVMASLTTDVAGGNWVAGVTKTMTVTSTVANTRYAAGAVIGFNITKAGTGVVIPAGTVISIDVEEEGPDGYAI